MLQSWEVHKFGGTSVLNAERYQNAYQILTKQAVKSQVTKKQQQAVVVSAMKGVTDDLIKVIALARRQDESYKTLLQRIRDRHINEAIKLLSGKKTEEILNVFLGVLEVDFHQLTEILRGVWLVKSSSEHIVELVSGMGEIWSAQLFNAYFQKMEQNSCWLDARQILVVEHINNRVLVDWQKSQEKFELWQMNNTCDSVIISGYVASLADGTSTTLGRNGSDYSASIFGVLFNCFEIYIWTDVDGVLSADPSLEPEAIVLNEMSYYEVMELAYFGAKVVHPSTMTPAIKKEIIIWIKNSFRPDLAGTKIHKNAKSNRVVKGFSCIDQLSLFNLEGTGMVGIPGVAERLFGALRAGGVNVIFISQSSSEQSICFTIASEQTHIAKKMIEDVFAAEFQKGLIQRILIQNDISILAAVGDNMAKSPGVAGQFFTSLGRAGVNVRAIAQGATERNISAVIDSKDAIRALRTVHSSFIISRQRISVGLIGVGLIGSAFLRQLNEQLHELRAYHNIDIQVRGLANSTKMLLADYEANNSGAANNEANNRGLALENWKVEFATKSESLDLKKFIEHLQTPHIPHVVIIESTASSSLCPLYKEWLTQGLHIITPNKKANTNSMKEYLEIKNAAQQAGRHFLYSTNVGAGLPIIQTLRDLHSTGDKIHSIQGVLSGTLSFIFNRYDGQQAFSEVVLQAKEKGFTEPDPREDLSGQDVMRKIVILAREIGIAIEPHEVQVESLIPPALQLISLEEFLRRLPELDAPMAELALAAAQEGKILRFVGTIDQFGKARVGLEKLTQSHAFASTRGTDNIVLFQTKRYRDRPLVVQGPGAGPEVTAAGVFADLLKLSKYLGAV